MTALKLRKQYPLAPEIQEAEKVTDRWCKRGEGPEPTPYITMAPLVVRPQSGAGFTAWRVSSDGWNVVGGS